MFKGLLVVLAAVGFVGAQEGQQKDYQENPITTLEQSQSMVVDCLKNLTPEEEAKVIKAKESMEQMEKLMKENPEEAEKLMDQFRVQSQEQIKAEVEKLPLETQDRIKKAIKEIEASKTQRAIEFKTISNTKCN